MDEVSEWCSSFVLVPQVNGRVRLCLDPARIIEVGWDGDNDETLEKVLQVCGQANFNLITINVCLGVRTSLLWKNSIRERCKSRAKPNSKANRHATTKYKELQSYLGILNCLSKFSPAMEEMCGLLHKVNISKNRLDIKSNVPRSI